MAGAGGRGSGGRRRATAAPALSLIVPARNEGDNVRRLCRRLQAALSGVRWELIVVDDSDDDTPERLRQLACEDGRLRVRHRGERPGSLGSAVVEGARLARAPWCVVMDADLQHPPELVPDLLRALRGGADLAVASRFRPAAGGPLAPRHGGDRRASLGRLGAARRANAMGARLLARLALREARRTSDPLSGFFGCRRACLLSLPGRPLGWKILLEVLVRARPARVADVPYDFAARDAGHSKLSLRVQAVFLAQVAALVAASAASRRFWVYAAVGGAGVVCNVGIYALGRGAGLPALAAGLVATHAAMAGNFLLHTRTTWGDRPAAPGSTRGRALRFLFVSELGVAVNLGGIVLASRWAPGHPFLGDLGGIVLALPATYSANDRWTWWRPAAP